MVVSDSVTVSVSAGISWGPFNAGGGVDKTDTTEKTSEN